MSDDTAIDAGVRPVRGGVVLTVAAIWFAIALAAGAGGLIARLTFPVPQLILLGLTVALIVLGVALPPFRAWLMSVELRAVVALHLTRLVAGAGFVALAARGELSPAFAVPAGWGDIATAGLAVGVLFIRPDQPSARRLYLAWNAFGMLDILFVVVNAGVQGVRDPAGMAPLLRLPLSLLPTFLVPLIIASHVLLFVRLTRRRERG
jgi:hypothetical protein